MTRKKNPKNSPAPSVPVMDSFPARSEIRPVSLLPKKINPRGYVAHCFPCNWSTSIMCDEVSFNPAADIETGYEAAKRLLYDHFKTCPFNLPVPYRTRPEEGSS